MSWLVVIVVSVIKYFALISLSLLFTIFSGGWLDFFVLV